MIQRERDKYFKIRNILNIVFMLSALVGVYFYMFSNRTVGTVIVLAAIVIKMIECCLRFIHR